jgi:gliding motility-associated-like protein
MRGSIGNKLKIFFLIATFSYISPDSWGQFYVGGKLCVGTPTPTTPPVSNTQSADCSEPTIFFDTEKDATAWLWDFGDPTTLNDVSTVRNPKYNYAAPGKYIVSLTRTVGGVVQPPVTKDITIGTPPTQPLFYKKKKGDTTLCDGKTLKLDPYRHQLGVAPRDVKFLWYPKGQTTQTIDVDSAGCYSVEVFDITGGCSRTAQINVKFCLQESGGGGSEKWYFGRGATLDFQSKGSPPLPKDTLANSGDLFGKPQEEAPIFIPAEPTKSNPIDSPEGAAMVYDKFGSLVFYTDGVKVYDKNDRPLAAFPPLTSSDLGGTNTATQSAVIIPKSACNECPHHQYYVYTINKTTGLLSYSIIDLRRNNGDGAVVEKDIPINFQTSQRLTAIRTQDETGYFVYSHDAGSNAFRILKIDSTGTTEIVQNIGLVHSDTTSEKGYMRLSASGSKMAVAVSVGGKNYIELYDIDPATGRLGSSPTTIDLGIAAPPYVYGVEFSEDEQKLYITLRGDPKKGQTSYLYQLNLNLRDPSRIATQKILIDRSTTMAFGALQMGPISGAGKKFIYMAIDGSSILPYIQEPELVGGPDIVGYQPITSGFGAEVLGNSAFGLPNVIQAKPEQDGEGLNATYEGTCQGLPTIFSTEGICSPMKGDITWDFGDGSAGTGKSTSHTYDKSGRYIVTLKVVVYSETEASKNINVNIPIIGNALNNALKERCKEFTVTDTLYIKPSPIINLPDSAFVCVIEGSTLLLDPKLQRAYNPSFLWTPTRDTTRTLTVSALGNYTVKATNKFVNNTTCAATDKIQIKEGCEPRLFTPEIFTANKDNINERFEIPNAHITDFELRIFNRWGEIIFESKDPDHLWDGSYNGKVMAPMMYAFVVSYKSKYFPYREKITRRGGIFLVN